MNVLPTTLGSIPTVTLKKIDEQILNGLRNQSVKNFERFQFRG